MGWSVIEALLLMSALHNQLAHNQRLPQRVDYRCEKT